MPTMFSTATITISSTASDGDFSRGNNNLSDLIPLKDTGETQITINVNTQGDRSVQYQITVNRSRYINEGIDIDSDDDGLVEIEYIEDLDAIRYSLDRPRL